MTIKESVLFTKKKKKKKWLVAGTAAENRRPPCGDSSDPRPTTSGSEPGGLASFAPATATASGGAGEKTNPTLLQDGEAEGSCTLARGWRTARVSRGAAGLAGSP